MIDWTITKEDFELITQIAKRGELFDYPYRKTLMDLHACHSNGCPLDLEGLLTARMGDFCHDLNGITSHIDCETGKLTNYFTPRYAKGQ